MDVQKDFHSGKRLKLTREFHQLGHDDLIEQKSFPNADKRTLQRWEQKGINKNHVGSVANFFGIDEWFFISESVSQKDFQLVLDFRDQQKEIKKTISEKIIKKQRNANTLDNSESHNTYHDSIHQVNASGSNVKNEYHFYFTDHSKKKIKQL